MNMNGCSFIPVPVAIFDNLKHIKEQALLPHPNYNGRSIGLQRQKVLLLLIHGSEDVMQPVDEIEKLKNRFEVHIIDGAGHVFFNENLWYRIFKIITTHIDRRQANGP